MNAWAIIGLVFGSCIFVLTVAAWAFNAGANLVKSHYTEQERLREEVSPR